MTAIYLERREPACNLQRFYAIAVTQTLSGGYRIPVLLVDN
jgi:predicted DNA-binding WGR domain protein